MSDRLRRDPMTGAEIEAYLAFSSQEDLRSQGWGRELMSYAEQWAREHGARETALNVFGRNLVARRLYSSLGSIERSVTMAKTLTP